MDDDTVPDQASGAVEDELDGDLLDNEDMSYLPCVSRLSTRAGILCIRNFKPGKSQLKCEFWWKITVRSQWFKSFCSVSILPSVSTLALTKPRIFF